MLRTVIKAEPCGTPTRRQSLSADMLLNDDMLRPRTKPGAILWLSPHGEIASPCWNHNPDRPGFVNGLRSAALAAFMAMVDVRVVRMPAPKRFMPAPASSLNLIIALLLASRLPSIGPKGAALAVGFCGGVGLSLVLFVLALRHLGSPRTGAISRSRRSLARSSRLPCFGRTG